MDNMDTEKAAGEEFVSHDENETNPSEFEQKTENETSSFPWEKIFSFIGNAIWWIIKSLLQASWWIVKAVFLAILALLPGLLRGLRDMGKMDRG